MYQVALFLHLLGALAFVAGIVLAGVAFEAARRRALPGEIVALLALARVGVLLVAVGTVLLGVFGFWLVHLGDWGYGTTWVDLSIGLFVLALVLGGLGGQRPKRARKLAVELRGRSERVSDELQEHDDRVSRELRALLDDPTSRVLNYASLLLVVAVLALMVWGP